MPQLKQIAAEVQDVLRRPLGTAEARETVRYDDSMAKYEKASTQTYVSLAVLNAGQAVIFTLGMTAVMWLAARDILAGRTTIGGFVLANTMLVQLSMPLNFMGMIYREIKQALIDIDDMFRILHRNPEIADRPDARPLVVRRGTARLDRSPDAVRAARDRCRRLRSGPVGLGFRGLGGHRAAGR